ncbi:hypothetical protein GMST_16140 [Geomonas silvestris]|uniref:Thioredoxin-like fold domain-containing protein n=1 Tax=Geomonas silvestris TaxID=2740184 RepID=A0A6V8MI18_9BACT|nr:thioredoxin family protein [Geomonas silvestris]GFO59289.1 hypothetical protein GMST_16140 [Geomonas silvestris]
MISWESDMARALARAKAEQKCILLEFFSHECIGCKQMDAVSFPDESVENFISDRMVPLRVEVAARNLASDFRVVWTPTIITLDYYGKEHQRTLGFLPPQELVPSLLLGIGKVALEQDLFSEAVIQFSTLLNGCPESDVAAEAVYLRGVARYRSSHAVEALKEAHRQLAAEYPGSIWTKKAQPYTLL